MRKLIVRFIILLTCFWTCSFLFGTGNPSQLFFASGAFYTGPVTENSIENGKGILTYNDGSTYDGAFRDGKRNGYGIFTFASGSSYQGFWIDDQLSGTCTYITQEGKMYEGVFKEGKFTEGTCSFTQGGISYVFKYPWKSVTVTLPDGTTYVGSYKGTSLTGWGVITYSNGDQYKGQVLDGKKSGHGVYTFQNKMALDGSWLDDVWQGAR